MRCAAAVSLWLALGCGDPAPRGEGSPSASETAEDLAREHLILDGHIDLPMRLHGGRAKDGSLTEDVSVRTEKGDFDYVRATEGGLDAAFMSIFIPARYEAEGGGKTLAEEPIDLVEDLVERSPDKFALAGSPETVWQNKAAGRISLAMGMENGTPLEGQIENVAHFHERGIRYITLTHSRDNHISDSSFDDSHTHGGLSAFGREVVKEMNRVGIMIDVSHVSDEAFWDVLELSETPVIASHSSCRHFTPGWERNMSDEMITALAQKGGVIQINFGSYFVDEAVRTSRERRREELRTLLEEQRLERTSPEARAVVARFTGSSSGRKLASPLYDQPNSARGYANALRNSGAASARVHSEACVRLAAYLYDQPNSARGPAVRRFAIEQAAAAGDLRLFQSTRILSHGDGGHVVNTASIAGMFGFRGTGPYNATKFAVVGISETMMAEHRNDDLGVSVLRPPCRGGPTRAHEQRPEFRIVPL